MSAPVDFPGSNIVLGPPAGRDETSVQTMFVFTNGVSCTSRWEFTDEELAEIVRTRGVFVSVWFGKTQPPVFVGVEESTRQLLADNGAWRRT